MHEELRLKLIARPREMDPVLLGQARLLPGIHTAQAAHQACEVPIGAPAFSGQSLHDLLHLQRIPVRVPAFVVAVIVAHENKDNIRIDRLKKVEQGVVAETKCVGIERIFWSVGVIDAYTEDDQIGR